MRIKEFTIKNFKNIGIIEPCTIVFPNDSSNSSSSDFITIIGENNIGKSSIFEALQLFLPETGINNIPTLDMFPNKQIPQNEKEFMEIEITLNDFNRQDREHDFLKPYIYDNEIKIKRIWKNHEQADKEVPFKVLKPVFELCELETSKPFNKTNFSSVSEELKNLYDSFCTEQNISNGTIPSTKKGKFLDYVYNRNCSLLNIGEPEWQDNPNGFASNLRSVLPKVIYVPAVKLIDDEADASKSKSSASLLTSVLFDKYLNTTQEFQKFNTALSDLQKLFMTETRNPHVQILEDKISEKLKRVLNVEANLDFTTPEVMKKLYLNSNILIKYNDLVTTPNQQGNGVQRLLILSLLELLAEHLTEEELENNGETNEWKRPFLFIIEEPEIYLHPHLQRKMRDSLIQISNHALAQVICTSHSENFINLADRHQGLVILKKSPDNNTRNIQVTKNIYDGDTASEKRSRMRMLLNFNPSTLEAFFARRVILVEGDCEVASINAIRDKLIKYNPSKAEMIKNALQEVSIIPCNGKLTQKAYFDVLKHFNVVPYLVHDLDNEHPNEGRNLSILNSIKKEEYRLTHSPNFEEDIFNQHWESDKPWRAVKLIENSFDDYNEKLIRFFRFVIGEDIFDSWNLITTHRTSVLS